MGSIITAMGRPLKANVRPDSATENPQRRPEQIFLGETIIPSEKHSFRLPPDIYKPPEGSSGILVPLLVKLTACDSVLLLFPRELIFRKLPLAQPDCIEFPPLQGRGKITLPPELASTANIRSSKLFVVGLYEYCVVADSYITATVKQKLREIHRTAMQFMEREAPPETDDQGPAVLDAVERVRKMVETACPGLMGKGFELTVTVQGNGQRIDGITIDCRRRMAEEPSGDAAIRAAAAEVITADFAAPAAPDAAAEEPPADDASARALAADVFVRDAAPPPAAADEPANASIRAEAAAVIASDFTPDGVPAAEAPPASPPSAAEEPSGTPPGQ